ncbi:N-acetyl sugar amidotransferase [Flaviaesturariibacter flavus]|uniref:N-acetyl sugar amidotransferase n=1 Tax=Flaviaesturariibacter flavus TaxID=2502780 RepID=A0A4R1BB20_9BACT|nr:N-acetyl sugar amidotransferase [Flaviaesturariibacter flavus]TCJ14181.1 N-acetyl sugar amidotransferase [Flaviaesturariibacter flavus]
MKYCKNCLNVDTRPNIKFTEDGLCPPCANYLHPQEIDWDERREELKEAIEFGRQHSNSGYDCIIGVSGGKDSTRQALYVKEALGMNPLLVSLNYPPEQMSERGARNLSNLVSLGFDCVNVGCSPQIWRKLMRTAFFEFGNWAKATEIALFSSVPRAAIAYQIPLIWWGENAAVVLGDLGMKGKSGSDGNRLKYSNTLAGGDISWILKEGLSKHEVLQYTYPSDEEMERAKLRIVFLAHFWKDFSIYTNGNVTSMRGLDVRPEDIHGNADHWGTSMLDEDFFIMNMMIKWLKFGFGRASDNINEEIRYGRVSREEGIRIVELFDGKCSKEIIEEFCDYIEISVKEFWEVVDRYANKELFERKSEGVYIPKFKVGTGL